MASTRNEDVQISVSRIMKLARPRNKVDGGLATI
jgi:hypothetical protein